MVILPHSCPQKGWQGNTLCVGTRCGYYEMKPVTWYYRWKLMLLTGKTPEEYEEDARGGETDDSQDG